MRAIFDFQRELYRFDKLFLILFKVSYNLRKVILYCFYTCSRTVVSVSSIMSAMTVGTMENEMKVRSMKETCYIVAFCDKFKSVLRGIEFWPEVRSLTFLNL